MVIVGGGWWLIFNVYHYGIDDPLAMQIQQVMVDQHRRLEISQAHGYAAVNIGFHELWLDNYKNFSPRDWAIQNTGSSIATRILNAFIRKTAIASGESYTSNIVGKVNSPNLTYKDTSLRDFFKEEYHDLSDKLLPKDLV